MMLSPCHENEVSNSQYQPLTVKVNSMDIATPPRDLRTPVKSLAQGYYFQSQSHQYNHTPTTRPHLGLLSGVCSPKLHTPKSGSVSRTANLCRQRSGENSCKSTPKYTTPGGTSHRIVRNPFESPGQAELLQNHVFSPNCFKHTGPGSAEKTPTSFRWSIDQIALLNPADIEEMPIQQDTLNIRHDRKTEAYLQHTLDNYFNNEIAPSPFHRPLPKHVLPATPGNHHGAGSPMLEYLRETGKYVQENVTVTRSQCDASCQTTLTLPTEFDLEEILAKHYTYKEVEAENAGPEDNSMKSDVGDAPSVSGDSSSLRRKLFFHGDLGTPLSPVRQHGGRHSLEEGYSIQPAVCTPDQQQQLRRPHPNAAQFSSSPLRPGEQSRLRRCSTAPDLEALASPVLSPIGSGPRHRVNRSPMLSPIGVGTDDEGGTSPMLSPIIRGGGEEEEDKVGADDFCPMHATPSPSVPSSRPSRRSLQMPPMSPIDSGSYIESSPESDERAFSALSRDHRSPPPPLCLGSSPRAETSYSTHHSNCSGLRLSPSDFDEGVSFLSHSDPTTSQDTGYNTESGIAAAHTNLTTQFGQLPLDSAQNVFTMDSDDNACFETAIPISTRQHRPMSISRQFSLPEPKISFSTCMSEPTSLQSSLNEPDGLMRSLPEPLPATSIPISISRQPSVSYELHQEQARNEASPPSSSGNCESDDDIIRRARKILGKEVDSPELPPYTSGVPGLSWYMDGSNTPQRERLAGLARTLERRQHISHNVHSMLPSEVAYEILRKAGTDFNKVCSGQQLDDTCYYEDAEHTDMSFTN